MDIENDTGFPHFQFKKVGYYGELFTVVVVSQTFKLSYNNGRCLIADEQSPPVMVDSWYGEPELSSLKTSTDLVIFIVVLMFVARVSGDIQKISGN